ncbi:MAG: sigma factor-like helix-turn-helix DNA-binding protein [Geminicoccaceae bacterium]
MESSDEEGLPNEVGLIDPLVDADFDEEDEDDEGITPRELGTTDADIGLSQPAAVENQTILDFYDDDDFDDFDDLYEVKDVKPETSVDGIGLLANLTFHDHKLPSSDLPDHDSHLDDLSSSDAPDTSTSLPPGREEAGTGPGRADDNANLDVVAADPPTVTLDELVEDDDAKAGPRDTSLALQPIPELQSKPRAPLKAPSKQNHRYADPVGPLSDTDHADADDDVEVVTSDMSPPAFNPFDIEELEIEPLGAQGESEDDWHAHLADVLGANGNVQDLAPGPLETQSGQERQTSRENDPSAVLPLSKTLTQLAASNPPKMDDPALSLPVVTARQKMAASDPPPMLPTEATGGMSPEQLPLGIIANVSRLRRFAVAQIGDELAADELVQATVVAALANTEALDPDYDLGITLMTLFCERRRKMLSSVSAPERSPEAVRTFEAKLCQGLAGADQFEIREFAQAINGLDEHDRELLVLVALESLSYDQIAGIVHVPIELIMTEVSKARIRLRQALNNDEATGDQLSLQTGLPHEQEIEIHGYLDGELDGRHMADIDALVEYDQDAADRLLHYGIQGDLIRRLYAPLINRPIPGKMLQAFATAAKPARRVFGFGPKRTLLAGAFLIALAAGTWSHIVPA